MDDNGRTNGEGGRHDTLDELQRRQVIEVLRTTSPVTQPELVRITGLPRSTVSETVRVLERRKLLHRESLRTGRRSGSTTGRPPKMFSLAPRAGCAVGIDFGHRHIRVAVSDLHGSDLTKVLEEQASVYDDAHASLRSAARLASRALDSAGQKPEQVVGVGVGIPGPLDQDRGLVAWHQIMPSWQGLDPAEEIEKRLRWPTHYLVENDASLGAVAEHEGGAAEGCSSVLYVKWSTGIGAGVIVDGRLHHGRRGLAGEIGHVPVPGVSESSVRVCPRCGNRGCLESLVTGDAFDKKLIRAKAGDRRAQLFITDLAELVGRAIGPIVTMLNLERIVIGGAFDAAAYGVIAEGLDRGLRASTFPPAFEDVTVRTGELTGQAAVRGALSLVLRRHLTGYVAARARTVG